LSATFGADVVRKPGYRRALIEASIVTNAALASYSIRRELGDNNLTGLKVVYGVYLLDTREVWSPIREVYSGLATAPDSDAAFSQLGDEIARSKRIASLIEANE
jgi:carbonic anhydrase